MFRNYSVNIPEQLAFIQDYHFRLVIKTRHGEMKDTYLLFALNSP